MQLLHSPISAYDRILKQFYVISMDWVADVPPCETSPAAMSEEKRLFSQARAPVLFIFLIGWAKLIIVSRRNKSMTSVKSMSNQ